MFRLRAASSSLVVRDLSRRKNDPRGAATAASALVATATSALLLLDSPTGATTTGGKEWQADVEQNYSSLSTNHVTRCDHAALLTALPRMRRHATVEKLHEVATEDEKLEDKYKVQWNEPLGEGAFGAVYSAVHQKTGDKVAVKKISKRLTNSVTFQREMDALLLLRENGGHPNVCSMRENFEEDNFFYIVMDLVCGSEMFERLCCEGPYSEADAARAIQEAANGLSFLHGIGITHCDIKPENLMLSSNDENAVVKIIDLGCSHLERNAPFCDHQQKSTANTPAYCPPEVLAEVRDNKHRHPTINPAFDMWSLGIVVYIMLVGAHPFDLECSSTDKEIEERILSGEKPPLRDFKFAEHLSDDAMSLIEGLLEWDPKKRLTAEQVLQNRWVRGETATSKKIADSDKRLAVFRKYSTRIGATFFKTLLSQTDAIRRKKYTERKSLLELAFRRLDSQNRGYISTNEIQCDGDTELLDEDDAVLSFSDVESLLSENIKSQYFPKGHVMYHEGDSGDTVYLIDSGKVEVTTKEGLRKVRQAGEMFGDDAMGSADKLHMSTVRCSTPVHVLSISRALFQKYVSLDKETFLSMAETDRHRKRERANAILRLHKEDAGQETYNKGDKIFCAGEKRDDLYMLEEGEVLSSVNGHKMRALQPGEMMGEHAAYFHKPYNVTAECVSGTCKVQVLPSEAMHRLLDADPSLRKDFRDLLLRRDFKKALVAEIQTAFPSTEDEIRSAFDAIDTKRSGAIEFDKLRAVVKRFDPSYSDDDIHDMLDSLDLNHNGRLTWEEFNRIFAMDKEA